MSYDSNTIIREITQIAYPILDEKDFELVDVEYLSEHGTWVLRIYVDKEGGITLDECGLLSREIGELIDVKDILQHEYVLEVSSPGLDRPLKKERDFLGSIGKKIKIKMLEPVNGRRNFTGYLQDFNNGTLALDEENQVIFLSFQAVEKANLVYDFEN